MESKAVHRFLKYAAVGVSTFVFDLLLIWLMTEFAGVPYWISTWLGFAVAVSCNYFISRRYVFCGTSRELYKGYALFIAFALGGATLISASVAFLVTTFALHYLIARIIVAAVVGMGNYLFNLHVNFKVAGRHQ